MKKKQKIMLYRIIITAVMLVVLQFLPITSIPRLIAYLAAYLVIGYDILRKAGKGILNGRAFDENFLMALATLGAFFLAIWTKSGDYLEGIAVMLFYQIGELFQSYAVGKSRKNISALMDIRPDYANIEKDGKLEQVDPDEVAVGSIIVVQPGEKVPLDGVVESGNASLNTSALTGESLPRDVKEGDEIISGCINLNGVLKIRTTKEFGESTVSKILDLVENASSRKSRSEAFISRFAKIYTPAVCISAVLLGIAVPLLRMAFSGLRTDLPPQEDQTDWEAYATYSDAVPSPNNVPYSRYWHGYTFALRLLLCLFTFTNLQMLLLFAQTALLLWTVLLMVRRCLQQLIPAFAVSWFFMSPPALGLCLQYAPVSLIALLACSLLLALKPALSRSVGLPVFFALIGLFVNYFDLLTFPVVSLSFPLILLIALETKTTISFGGLMREALLCCVGWALGYACMWMLKWGLNFLVLGQDGIAAVGDQISLRLSAGGESHSRLDILLRNIRIVTDKTAYRVILLAVLALLLALFIRRRPRRLDGRALLLLLPLLAPVLWTLALSNHASDHTYFTYRNLCGAFFALFALPALLAPDRTPSL